MDNLREVKTVSVIRCQVLEGNGTQENPAREVYKFYLPSGEVIGEIAYSRYKKLLVEIQGEDISPSNCLTEAISKKRPTFEDHIRANYHEAGKEKVAVEIGKLLNGFSMTEAKDILSMVSYELDKVAYIKTE